MPKMKECKKDMPMPKDKKKEVKKGKK